MLSITLATIIPACSIVDNTQRVYDWENTTRFVLKPIQVWAPHRFKTRPIYLATPMVDSVLKMWVNMEPNEEDGEEDEEWAFWSIHWSIHQDSNLAFNIELL
jgi:hypothetical protein